MLDPPGKFCRVNPTRFHRNIGATAGEQHVRDIHIGRLEYAFTGLCNQGRETKNAPSCSGPPQEKRSVGDTTDLLGPDRTGGLGGGDREGER
jgi:hypothetical protein